MAGPMTVRDDADKSPERLRAELQMLRTRLEQLEHQATVHQRVECELRAVQERFELATSGANDGIWDWDLTRGEVYFSERFLALIGYEKGEIEESYESFLALLHPDDVARTEESIKRTLEAGDLYRTEFRLRSRDESYRWFLARGRCQYAADGTPIRFAGSIADIEDQKTAEESDRLSRLTYRNLFDTSLDGILVADLDGHVEEVNQRLLDMLGYSAEELRGMCLEELTPERWRATDQHASRELESRGASEPYAKEYLHRDGYAVPIELQIWRVEGERPQLFALVRDMSPRRKAQADLRRMEDQRRLMGDALPARIAYIDRHHRYQFTNVHYRRRFGLEEQDLHGCPLVEVIGEETYAEVLPHIQAALAGESVRFERKEAHESGRVTFLHTAYEPFRNEAGEVEGFYALITDVTEQKRVAQALESSEQRFRSLCARSPVGIFEADAHGSLVYMNRRWEELTGLNIEELLGQGWIRAIHPDDLGRVTDAWTRSLEAGDEYADEFRVLNSGGEARWIVTRSNPIRDEYERLVGHVGTALDVTERVQAEVELRESLEMLQTMADSLPVLIGFIDAEQRYRFNNRVYEEWYGVAREQITGRSIREVMGEANYQRARADVEAALAGESRVTELEQTFPDGKRRVCEAIFTPQRGVSGDVRGYWIMAQDITARKESEDQIWNLAYFDSLTCLPNRQFFQKEAAEAIERAKAEGSKAGLIFIDLDRFKNVNDTLGHEGGDRLLVQVARRLQVVARMSGVLRTRSTAKGFSPIARFGGDEFTILIEDLEGEDMLEELARAIMEALAEPIEVDGHSISITATLGVAVYPSDAISASDLLRHADSAMYQGKRSGRARVVGYSPSMDRENLRRIELEARLREALHAGEFSMAYQVQRTARGGFLAGAEALIRWTHPELGVVPPSEFIGVAEESGLILPIGEWVFSSVCEQCKAWEDAGFEPHRVGINVSPRQLRDTGLAERFREICNYTGVDPSRLELEITESALVDDPGVVATVIEQLRRCGFQLALDDFGTGYSSLSFLRRFPIDRLKIDRSFVSGIPSNRADCELTAAVIAMAHNLRLKVVAEGVESKIQAEFLAQQGCDELQGFLLGRAEPPERFTRHLSPAKRPEDLA